VARARSACCSPRRGTTSPASTSLPRCSLARHTTPAVDILEGDAADPPLQQAGFDDDERYLLVSLR
jgi:hypothetical protein